MVSAAAIASGPILQVGSRGPAVRDWQEALTLLGLPPGAIDGDFGPRTAQKTMAFQAGHALVADGIVGPKTRAVAAGALPESA
ncbi:MAG TPA: peptidoglycan-binding domain-containing protein, partial [Chloroflexota bacterium]|nr:peptidoglycan-binding domain-containing protein [Chloroflexota bacterium]